MMVGPKIESPKSEALRASAYGASALRAPHARGFADSFSTR